MSELTAGEKASATKRIRALTARVTALGEAVVELGKAMLAVAEEDLAKLVEIYPGCG